MAWRSRNPIARAAHELARLDGLTAQAYELEGRVLMTLVGFRAGEVVYATTFTRETERARWWTHEPEEYDGA